MACPQVICNKQNPDGNCRQMDERIYCQAGERNSKPQNNFNHSQFATVKTRQGRGKQPDTETCPRHDPKEQKEAEFLNNQSGMLVLEQ